MLVATPVGLLVLLELCGLVRGSLLEKAFVQDSQFQCRCSFWSRIFGVLVILLVI